MASGHTHTDQGGDHSHCNHDHGHGHSGHSHDGHGHDGHTHGDNGGASHGTFKTYFIGFVLSIILTVIPFWLVMKPTLSHTVILASIFGLALVQIVLHLVCFLHMNNKSEQRWNNMAFAFTILIVAILIGGSVWIMTNANDNLMPKMPDLQTQE